MDAQAYLSLWYLRIIRGLSWHVSNVFQRLGTLNTKKIWTVKLYYSIGNKEKWYVGSNSQVGDLHIHVHVL